jgi:RNA recognition motif-containing protein
MHTEVMLRWLEYIAGRCDEGELELVDMTRVARQAAVTCGQDVELGARTWDAYQSYLLEEFQDEDDEALRTALKAEVFWCYRERLALPLVDNDAYLAGMEDVLGQLGCTESDVTVLQPDEVERRYLVAVKERPPRLVLEDAVQSALQGCDKSSGKGDGKGDGQAAAAQAALWQATWNYISFERGPKGRGAVAVERLWQRATVHLSSFVPMWETYAQELFATAAVDSSRMAGVLGRGLRACPQSVGLWRLWSYEKELEALAGDGDNGGGSPGSGNRDDTLSALQGGSPAEAIFAAVSSGKMTSPLDWLSLNLVGLDCLRRAYAAVVAAKEAADDGDGSMGRSKGKGGKGVGQVASEAAEAVDAKFELVAQQLLGYWPAWHDGWWAVISARLDFARMRSPSLVPMVLAGARADVPTHAPVYRAYASHYLQYSGADVSMRRGLSSADVDAVFLVGIKDNGLVALGEEWLSFTRSTGASVLALRRVARAVREATPVQSYVPDMEEEGAVVAKMADGKEGDQDNSNEKGNKNGKDKGKGKGNGNGGTKRGREEDSWSAAKVAKASHRKKEKKEEETEKEGEEKSGGRSDEKEKEVGVMVKGLPVAATEADVKMCFNSAGRVKRVKMHFSNGGRPRGSAIVHYSTEANASAAVAQFHEAMFPESQSKLSVVTYAPKAKSSADTDVPTATVFVSGLTSKTTSVSLGAAFSDIGVVDATRVLVNKATGASQGRGLVQFQSPAHMELVLKGGPRTVDGIEVSISRSKYNVNANSVGGSAGSAAATAAAASADAPGPALDVTGGRDKITAVPSKKSTASVKGFKPRVAMKPRTAMKIVVAPAAAPAVVSAAPAHTTGDNKAKGNAFFRQFL